MRPRSRLRKTAKFQLTDLKAAKALGIEAPASLLAITDEVIE
jgi:hypothetical protein